MNIAQLLANGPVLVANPVSKRAGQAPSKRCSDKMISRYRTYSVGGLVWSTLIAPKEGLAVGTVAQNLKDLANRGVVSPVGRHAASQSSNKPVVYEWRGPRGTESV